jgi:hypothetical protein
VIAFFAELTTAKDSLGNSLMFSEWKVALLVFAITAVWYMIFVTGTISQICKSLDIYCLSIKKKDAKNK